MLWLFVSTVPAQTSINTSGENAKATGGSVSYFIGQVVYTISSGTNGSVSSGVQQPYEISIVTLIEEATDIKLSVLAYPNPTIDYLTLSIYNCDLSNLSYQLYDTQGKLLQNKKIGVSQTIIDMTNRVPATYFVEVACENKKVKMFKIIKK